MRRRDIRKPKFTADRIVSDKVNENGLPNGLRGVHMTFESPELFAAACERVGVQFESSSWNGDQDSAQALACVRNGDQARVEAAEALCDQFQNDIDLGQSWPQWEVDVCGAYPNVPNYLAGVPETMWRKQVVQSDKAPIVIWVCVTSSGGCEAKQLEARGIAIQALAMALSVTRAVKIMVYSGLGGRDSNHLVSVQLPVPAVLSQSAYLLSSQGFSRGLTYQYLYSATGANGRWPESIVQSGKYAERVNSWKRMLPINDVDLVFPHVYQGDPDYVSPVSYCKGIFDKVTSGELAKVE